MGDLNNDGSAKLGTLHTATLIALAIAQSVPQSIVDEFTLLTEDAEKSMREAAILLNGMHLIVPLDPKVPDSPKHELRVKQCVVYFQRHNPTRTMSAAQAKKEAEMRFRIGLRNALRECSAELEQVDKDIQAASTDEQRIELISKRSEVTAKIKSLADSVLTA